MMMSLTLSIPKMRKSVDLKSQSFTKLMRSFHKQKMSISKKMY